MSKPTRKPGAIVPPADVIPFKPREDEALVFDEDVKAVTLKFIRSMTTDELVTYVIAQNQYVAWSDMLVRHCWVHGGYPDCGRKHMSSDLKFLYDTIIGRKTEDE